MLNIERRWLDFICKHALLLCFITVTALSLWLRLLSLPFSSNDYESFLLPWFERLRAGGGLRALSQPIGNYNVPYLTVLALLTYLPVEPLVSIKAVSIVFDYVAAGAAAQIVYTLLRQTPRAKTTALITFAGVTLLPTLFLNSAYWAQCDSIYVAFLLLCLGALMKERYTAAFVWFALAFCFKLQAILLLPVLILLYFTKRRFSIAYFLIIPAVFLLGDMPALIAGRDVAETLSIYLRQADEYPSLTLNYPNFYYFLMGDYDLFAGAGIAITLSLLGLLTAYLVSRQWDISAENLLSLSLWVALICLYFLPSMHERYGLITDILSLLYFVVRRKKAYVPILINLSSLLSYTGFLFHYWVMDLLYFSIAKLVLLALLTADLLRTLERDNPPPQDLLEEPE